MIRRLLNVAAAVSVLVALLLAVGSVAYTPGHVQQFASGADGWGLRSLNGTLTVSHYFRNVLSIDMSELAVAFAIVPLLCAGVDYWWDRRHQQAKGFPVEPIQK